MKFFILGFENEEDVKILCKNFQPAGWILFSRNIIDMEQLRELSKSLSSTCGDFPVFVSIDQEGGRVNRLPDRFPSAKEMAEIYRENPSEFKDILQKMVRLLNYGGINLNLAPVVDVALIESEVIGDRSFSNDPEFVAEIAGEWIKIFSGSDIYSCLKHFPGHGGVKEDSHKELPKDNVGLDIWREIYLPPFERNFHLVEFVMSAHVVFKVFDSYLPASLSPGIKELLKEYGYEKFLVSDDLLMSAVRSNFSPVDIASLLLKNHTDFWIISKDYSYMEDLYSAIYDQLWKSEVKNWLEYHQKLLERFWKKHYGKISNRSE